MKKMLLSLFLFSIAAHASESPNAVFLDFKNAVDKNSLEFKSCTSFTQEVNAIVKPYLKWMDSGHKNKKQATDVLQLMESTKFHFPAGERAAEILLNKFDTLTQYSNQKELLEKQKILKIDCDPLTAMDQFILLIKDQKKGYFSKVESDRLFKVIKKFLLENPPPMSLSIISQAIRTKILEAYLEVEYKGADRVALLKETKSFLAQFDSDREKFKAELDASNRLELKPNIRLFKPEYDLGKKSYSGYMNIVKKVFRDAT